MTPHSRQILPQLLGYLESKIVQYWVVEPKPLGVKELRTGKQVKPRSLDRAYIKREKVRIAAAKALMAEKAAKTLAKEPKAKERAEISKATKRGAQGARGRGRVNMAQSRTARQPKYNAEGVDLQRL